MKPSIRNTRDIYNDNSMGNHYNRPLRIHNDITPEEAGLQSELGQDAFEQPAADCTDEPQPPNKTVSKCSSQSERSPGPSGDD